ncbi:hypothetical protein AAVH_22495 [Aphelenchoides avenae]|nr:hypothetical protein AAVH_22495 [Aphelenchus avenae]
MASAPKKMKVLHGGEAANSIKRKQDEKTLEQRKKDRANGVERQFKPKRSNSDGPSSKAVRVFYLRESATDEEPFGFLRYYRRAEDKQFAFLIFDSVAQARAAKKALEHTRYAKA